MGRKLETVYYTPCQTNQRKHTEQHKPKTHSKCNNFSQL